MKFFLRERQMNISSIGLCDVLGATLFAKLEAVFERSRHQFGRETGFFSAMADAAKQVKLHGWHLRNLLPQASKLVAKVIVVVLGFALGSATAQTTYPSRTVVLTAPAAAGGLTDILARTVADGLSKRLKGSVIVENKLGAGGTVGMATVSRSAPDGHSLILVFQGPATVAPSLYRNLSYDTALDFTAIGMVGSFQNVLVVGASSPLKSTTDLIDLAKKSPGKLNYGSGGIGATSHLAAELLQKEAGIKLTHIPYKGEGPMIPDLVSGTLDVAFSTLAAVRSMNEAGKLRMIGVGSDKRTGFAPDLPTISESGLPGFQVPGWYGILAPRKTPDAIVAKLRVELSELLKDSAFRLRLSSIGIETSDMTVREFEEWLRKDTEKWRALIAEKNIKAD